MMVDTARGEPAIETAPGWPAATKSASSALRFRARCATGGAYADWGLPGSGKGLVHLIPRYTMAMSTTMTVLHVQGQRPEAVEEALTAIFSREERPRALRIEGTYSAVLARATDPEIAASYRYLILRPHSSSSWTPVLELGNRTDGLDVELSRALDGAAVFTTYVFGDIVSGYRLARAGALVDRYASDPTYSAGDEEDE
ncbi:MAG TPA: hypothetical protein VKT52_02015, partial [Ktedonobacterales bacterium]|nr:hypothetical protein [Ktedonobacterales bacterium]